MSEIENANEVLIRLIPSYRIVKGRVNHKAFKPRESDANHLSVCKESGITAQDAFNHFTGVMSANAWGVAKLKVHEVVTQNLNAFHDPTPPEAYPFEVHHAIIDFTPCEDQDTTAKAFLKIAEDQNRIAQLSNTLPPPVAEQAATDTPAT